MIDFRHLALLEEDDRKHGEDFLCSFPEEKAQWATRNLVQVCVVRRAEQIVSYTQGYAPGSDENMRCLMWEGWNPSHVDDLADEQLLELMLQLDMGD